MVLQLSSMKLKGLKLFHSCTASWKSQHPHLLDYVLCVKPENNNPAECCRLKKTKFFSLTCTVQTPCWILKSISHAWIFYWCPWDWHKMCIQHDQYTRRLPTSKYTLYCHLNSVKLCSISTLIKPQSQRNILVGRQCNSQWRKTPHRRLCICLLKSLFQMSEFFDKFLAISKEV